MNCVLRLPNIIWAMYYEGQKTIELLEYYKAIEKIFSSK